MLKKINMIIISFFLILTIKGNLSFSLYLPVLLFYVLKNRKNIIYIYPVSFISILLFAKEMLPAYLILIVVTTVFLLLYQTGVKKDWSIFGQTKIVVSVYILLINCLMLFIYPKLDISVWIKLFYILTSILIYLFLDIYLAKLLKDFQNIKERFLINDNETYNSYILLEILLALLACFGASFVAIGNVNLLPLVGSYFAMYLSRKFRNIYSLLFGILATCMGFFGKRINEALIIVAISGIYTIRSIYTIGILNTLLAILILSKSIESPATYISIMVVSILFEIFAYFLMPKRLEEVDEYKEMHELAQKNVNEEILKFAGFLDRFVVGFQNPKDFNERLSSGIKTIIDQHCKTCPKQKECFEKRQKTLYPIFKDILTLDENFKDNYQEYINYCDRFQSIYNTSKLLNQQSFFKNQNANEKNANNYILLAQINGVSNALKNYVIDTTSKTELNYQQLQKAKAYLLELEYNVTYYEVVRSYEQDFLITIGIKNKKLSDIEPVLNSLFEAVTNCEVSIEFVKEENTTIYLNVIPKLIIDVVYAYGNMPTENQMISGDNYLVKEQNNGHMLFAISDGMGKGYSAFYESDMTLHLVEDIIKLNIDPSTALTILNTFYVVQDYLERYATLDFLDINRHNGNATFYKMGANTTYIFKQNKMVDKIINQSLPLGIDEEVDQSSYQLEDGDMIIMSSDGVVENLIDNDLLEEFISNAKDLAPQQIVYEILNYTIKNQIKTKDDMTVIVLKISTRKKK